MGTSYLTAAQKDALGNEFFNLAATFARPIVVFKTAQQVVISTNPEHNYMFNEAPTNSVVEEIVQSGICQARILYGKKQMVEPFNVNQRDGAADQPVIRLEHGEVRIKVDATGAALIGEAQRVKFDGTLFYVDTSDRPHGLFDPKFATYYLKRVQ